MLWDQIPKKPRVFQNSKIPKKQLANIFGIVLENSRLFGILENRKNPRLFWKENL